MNTPREPRHDVAADDEALFAQELDAYDGYDGHEGYDGYDDGTSDAVAEEYAQQQQLTYGDDTGPRSRRALREAERATSDRRRKRRRGVTILVVVLLVVAGGGFLAASSLRSLFSGGGGGSNDYAGPGTGSVSVVVHDGDTSTTIGTTLATAGVVKSARAFVDAAKADPASTGIQPGTYVMKLQMKASDALALLLDPAVRDVPKVVIREGLWKSETYAALSKATGVPVANYVAAAKDTAALGLPAAAKGDVEGYLFPATYEFPDGATAAQQLQTMVAKAVSELTALGLGDSAGTQTTLVKASIVEAEAGQDSDRGKVAEVIDNRLAQGGPIRFDSTAAYGVQKRGVFSSDATLAAKNGYNTYQISGLPVGPIGNPGLASIQAALHPTSGPWLYFTVVNPQTGETKFATTLAEHNQNVAELTQWCSQHPGVCTTG